MVSPSTIGQVTAPSSSSYSHTNAFSYCRDATIAAVLRHSVFMKQVLASLRAAIGRCLRLDGLPFDFDARHRTVGSEGYSASRGNSPNIWHLGVSAHLVALVAFTVADVADGYGQFKAVDLGLRFFYCIRFYIS